MRCPFCGHLEDRVVDSRASKDGHVIRRRRECADCERRFTSYERIEEPFPAIVKRGSIREDYDRDKLMRGLRLACNKRPISREQIEDVVDAVERRLIETGQSEVDSNFLGDALTEELRGLDPVAYIRFASVYRGFSDIQEFLRELQDLERSELSESSDTEDDPS